MKTQTIKVKVAIIGLGKIGEAIASNFIKGNHEVILASRNYEKAKLVAKKLGHQTHAKEINIALNEADVIIPTIYFDKLKDFIKTHHEKLEGKIIIDVSNPIAPDGNGGFIKTIGEHESAGKVLASLIPKNSKLIKTFGTLGADSLKRSAFNQPERKIMFYASDSINYHALIESLIKISGFEPYHVGGLDQSNRIEVLGDLHEFGALGKSITLHEFKQKNINI